jgi:hypothetical protein
MLSYYEGNGRNQTCPTIKYFPSLTVVHNRLLGTQAPSGTQYYFPIFVHRAVGITRICRGNRGNRIKHA